MWLLFHLASVWQRSLHYSSCLVIVEYGLISRLRRQLKKPRFFADEAVVKSYALPGEGNKPFLAYLIPVDGGGDDDKVDSDQARWVPA